MARKENSMASVLEEKNAICELFAKYCFYTDACQFEKNAALFTEDCEWDGGPLGCHRGRANFMAFFKSGPAPNLRHSVSNIHITLDGDEARAVSYLQVLDIAKPMPAIVFCGIYLDHLVKRDGRWLFKQRKVRRDLTEAGEF
jgi:SnoaL-like domain